MNVRHNTLNVCLQIGSKTITKQKKIFSIDTHVHMMYTMNNISECAREKQFKWTLKIRKK